MRLNSLKSTGSLGAMLTAGALSLAAGTASAETMLTVWSWDPNFNGDSMQRAMARYQAEHPDVSLVVADFGKDALEQKLQSQLASGSNQGLPDIVLIEDYAAQRFLLTFPQAFEPVGEHVDLSGMAPYKVALATVDGRPIRCPSIPVSPAYSIIAPIWKRRDSRRMTWWVSPGTGSSRSASRWRP